MIELNKKTQQDFLNREWVKRLLDAGVDMSDAKYYIAEDRCHQDYIHLGNPKYGIPVPTYTVSELLYKLRNRYGMYTIFNCYRNLEADNISIIETLASFLIQYYKKDIGLKTKDTGDISDK
jgi:hypothetical protein